MISSQAQPLTALLQRLPNRFRLGIILAVLGLVSVLIGIAAARQSTIGLLVLVGGPVAIAGALLVNRYFATLVLLLPLSALAMRPLALPVGNGSEMPISMILSLGLIGLWIAAMFTRRRWELVPTPFNRPLLAFMVVCIISLPWGIIWADPVLNWRIMGNFRVTQTASLLMLLALMGLPFLIARFITRPWQIWGYLWSFIGGGLLMTTTQFFGIEQSLFSDQGLWGLWFVLPLTGLVLVHPGVARRWRWLGAGLVIWHLYLVMIRNSLWVSGWLPTIIGLLALLFLHSRKAFAISMILVVLIAAVGPGHSYFDAVVNDNIDEGGLERLEIWERNLSLVRQHWLLGMGPAGYAPYNMTYFRDDARSTHNNYFDIVAQFGVIGLGLWFWFATAVLWYGWRTVQRSRPGLVRTIAIIATAGWVASFAAMMLGDWILPFVYNQSITGFRYAAYSWIFLGLLISVNRPESAKPQAVAP